MHTLLIVDDEAKLREVLAMALEGMGYAVLTAGSGEEALQRMEQQEVHLILCDLRMPKMSGKALLEKVKATRPELPVIIMTAFVALKDAVELIKTGAFDYLAKPFDLEALEATVTSALRFYSLGNDNANLRLALKNALKADEMIGESAALKGLLQRIHEVSTSDAGVLITGESGTGKELVARAIHVNSKRGSAPLVIINCAAINESLLESELFGHVKGAFTGATSNRVGRFAQADGGTLFLDEIGDMPLPLQAKILRALQDKVIEPVGGSSSRKVDVRIIAATNKNLRSAIEDGHFREDLFFRLNVYPIVTPALREREEDIPLLIQHFASLFAARMGKHPLQLTPEALSLLQNYNWPGNIRELQNFVERLTITHSAQKVGRDMIVDWLYGTAGVPTAQDARQDVAVIFPLNLNERIEIVEREIILSALKETKGVQAKAAALLNISERSMWHRIKKLGIVVRN